MTKTKSAAVLLLLATAIAATAEAGTLAGEAKDLHNRDVRDLTIRIFNHAGTLLNTFHFRDGRYNIEFSSPPGFQAVTIEFSAPTRKTTSVTLSTENANVLNVAMPVDDRAHGPRRTLYAPHSAFSPNVLPPNTIYLYRPIYPGMRYYQPYSIPQYGRRGHY